MTAPKPPTRRQNAGTGHSYYLDGVKVPGVTTLLDGIPKNLTSWAAGVVTDFVLNRLEVVDGHVVADEVLDDLRVIAAQARRPDQIPDWRKAKRLGATIGKYEWHMKGLPFARRDEAAVKGTAVHDLAERLAGGDEVEVPDHLVGFVDSYLKFRDDWRPTDERTEVVVVNRTHRYMGTADLLCRLDAPPAMVIDDTAADGLDLIDYKAGAKGVYETTGLQLAGYRYAEAILEDDGTETPMPPVRACYALWLRADGYDLIPFTAEEAELRVLLYAGQVKAFMEANNFRGDDPPAWVDRRHFRRLKGEALTPPTPTPEGNPTP